MDKKAIHQQMLDEYQRKFRSLKEEMLDLLMFKDFADGEIASKANDLYCTSKSIEYLKGTDITAYQQLYDNITTERVAVSYLMVKLYETRYAIDFMTKVKTDCRIDCERLGIDVMAEGSSINDLWLTWGIE